MVDEMKIPVLIGVGQVKHQLNVLENAIEPLHLILEAMQYAIRDTGLSQGAQDLLRSRIDSISVVPTWTWPYENLPDLLAQKMNVHPRHLETNEHGGHNPGFLLHKAAARVAEGGANVAVVCGGEALASMAALHKANIREPKGWTKRPPGHKSFFEVMQDQSYMSDSIGTQHGIGMPVQVYPLYENGLRAHRRQSLHDNICESAELYANFAKVASTVPTAWSHGQTPVSAATLEDSTGRNRMISTPYPLLMNAFNNVNQAAACLLADTETAAKLGIPQDHWIYPTGGAGYHDSKDFWLRPNFYSSPAIEKAIDKALQSASLQKEQIDLFDVYSCFPIVPKLVCQRLGFPIDAPPKPMTLLGGLTSFGGAGNNYSMHALVEMVQALRHSDKQHGLVLANGGVLTHQHAIILSSQPPKKFGLPLDQANHPAPEVSSVPFDDYAEGRATIETYTVDFDRHGKPVRGHVVGRLKHNGNRFIANHADVSTLNELLDPVLEPIGREGLVFRSRDGRNLFTFGKASSL